MTPSFVCGAVTPDPGGAESELLNAFARCPRRRAVDAPAEEAMAVPMKRAGVSRTIIFIGA
jgi:hypothetical protein